MSGGIRATFYREYKLRLSSPRVFVENIANPLFTLMIFGLTLGNTVGSIDVGGESINYLNYFVIGAINISLISNALVSATKMFLDKYVGMYEELLSYPVKRRDILIGKMLFNLLLSLVQAFVMMAFTEIITGYKFLNFNKALLLTLLVIIGSCAWFYIMMIISVKVRTQDSFNTIYYIIITPVVFTSSIYYPVEKLPVIFKWLGYINPISWLTDIGRYIYLELDSNFLVSKLIGIIVLLILSFFVSKYLFSKGVEK